MQVEMFGLKLRDGGSAPSDSALCNLASGKNGAGRGSMALGTWWFPRLGRNMALRALALAGNGQGQTLPGGICADERGEAKRTTSSRLTIAIGALQYGVRASLS
jgi:hypothetical protein